MLSTLLLYPRCPECGGNLPFVSRRYYLEDRDSFRSFGDRRVHTELTWIRCLNCGDEFSVTTRGFGLVVMGAVAMFGIAYLGHGGYLGSGDVRDYLLGAAMLVFLILWLVSHRMTELHRLPRPGETVRESLEVADVYARLEARDVEIKKEQDAQRAIREAEDTGVVNCPRCGAINADDMERCVTCDAVLLEPG